MPGTQSAPQHKDSTSPTPQEYPIPFGSYLLLDAFAHGGMGEVYLAKTGGIEGIERVCVVKKLRADVTKNREYVNRFLDEARVVVNLNHANICHVFDAGVVGNEYYLAMEYISGVNLRDIQKQAYELQRCLAPGVVIWMMAAVLEGLDYAHRHCHPLTGQPLHLVHRDISPQNIMVSYEGEVRLIDFGLAASELKIEQTESQVVMGKVAYMSPEQARGDEVSASTDQFSAAVVLYELLVGDRFYGPKSSYEIWQVVGVGGFTPRRWYVLDPVMKGILERALNPDPKKRYPTCGDFKDALYSYLLDEKLTTTNRAVREAVREFFGPEIEKEKSFLSQFTDLSAVALRTNTGSNPESGEVVSIYKNKKGGTLPYGRSQPEWAADSSATEELQAADDSKSNPVSESPSTAQKASPDMSRYDQTVIVQNRLRQSDTENLTSRFITDSKLKQGKQTAIFVSIILVSLAVLTAFMMAKSLSPSSKTAEAPTSIDIPSKSSPKETVPPKGQLEKQQKGEPRQAKKVSSAKPKAKKQKPSAVASTKPVVQSKPVGSSPAPTPSVAPNPPQEQSFRDRFLHANRDNIVTRSEAQELLSTCSKPCAKTWGRLLSQTPSKGDRDAVPQLAKASMHACFKRCSQP
jgi:serine/threonine protein kinase